MPADLDAQIATLRDRIHDGDGMTDADQQFLTEYADRLELRVPQSLGQYRFKKCLRHTCIMAERGPVPLAAALADRDAAEELKQWLDDEYANEETNRDYRVVLRQFSATVTDGDDPPESIAWIPTTYSNDYDPTPDPRDVLLWEEDVQPMLRAAGNDRDAAMIALQFDAGLRGGEFKALSRRDIQDHDHGLKVTVEGKQGRRSVLLVPAAPYVTDWLAAHPGADGGDPLWSKLGTAESVSDRLLYKQFDACAERAGVDKPVTLTNFRKSSAAYLARRNVNQAHIEDHHGWVRGSDAAARYIQVFGEDTDREVARAHGVDVSEETPDAVAPEPCPRCGETVKPHAEFCGACNRAVDREAAALVERALDTIDEQLLNADDSDERAALVGAQRGIRDSPSDVDLEKLHESLPSSDP